MRRISCRTKMIHYGVILLHTLILVAVGGATSSLNAPISMKRSLAAIEPYGLQTGPAGSDSYAGALSYDSTKHLLFLTGSTYSSYFGDAGGHSDCFLAILQLPWSSSSTSPADPKWIYTEGLGTTSPEGCDAIELIGDKLFMMGHAEEGGIMTNLRQKGTDKSTIYGFIMDFDLQIDLQTGETKVDLLGGALMHRELVQYPVALASDSDMNTYVAILQTDDDRTNDNYQEGGTPDLTKTQTYGRGYTVKFARYIQKELSPDTLGDIRETITEDWTQIYGTWDQSDAYISSLTYVTGKENNWLIFTGHTEGYGEAFGATSQGGDMDGFVTKLRPNDGSLPQPGSDSPQGVYSTRLSSSGKAKDIVATLCVQQGSQVEDIYVVGSTKGSVDPDRDSRMVHEAFLFRLDLDTLNVVWSKQLGALEGPLSAVSADPDVFGQSCAVTPDGTSVYMAGTVKNGAVIDHASVDKSAGGDDIFVAEYSTEKGDLLYARQIGSKMDDQLSVTEGIVCDSDGNAVVMGNTVGSFMRSKGDDEIKSWDIFILSVTKGTGAYKPPIDDPDIGVTPAAPTPSAPVGTPTNPPTSLPPVDASVPVSKPTLAPVDAPVSVSEPTNAPIATTGTAPTGAQPSSVMTSSESSDSSRQSKFGKVVGAFLFLTFFVCLALLGWVAIRRYRQYDEDRYFGNYPDSSHIAKYLQDFEDIDVELKHSATGGWHGMYDYGGGEKRAPMDEVSLNDETAPLTTNRSNNSSSIVQESLFMDDYEVPTLGGHTEEEEDPNQYNGLVDAYNSSWDDRSPHQLGTFAKPADKQRHAASGDVSDPAWGKEII